MSKKRLVRPSGPLLPTSRQKRERLVRPPGTRVRDGTGRARLNPRNNKRRCVCRNTRARPADSITWTGPGAIFLYVRFFFLRPPPARTRISLRVVQGGYNRVTFIMKRSILRRITSSSSPARATWFPAAGDDKVGKRWRETTDGTGRDGWRDGGRGWERQRAYKPYLVIAFGRLVARKGVCL